MNAMGRELRRGMKGLERSVGKPVFTWPSTSQDTYPCVANEASSSKIFGVGGFALEADLTLFVRAEVLPDPGPAEKQTILYKGRKYRIDSLAMLPGDEEIRMACNDPNRNL
jgi:hypothetical protein